MNCSRCEGETSVHVSDRYHYAACGLNNVYLRNVEVRACESCGHEAVRIPRIADLLARIGRAVALQNTPLRGADVRFLRKQLGMKATEWAKRCRIDAATMSRLENDNQRLGPQSDLLMRYVYIRALEEQEGYRIADAIVERLASVDRSERSVPLITLDVRQGEPEYLVQSSMTTEELQTEPAADFAARVVFAVRPSGHGLIAPSEPVVEETVVRLTHTRLGMPTVASYKPNATIALAA